MSFTPQNERQGQRLMLVGRHRVFYFGLLGRPAVRNFGSATLYASARSPLHVNFGDGWQERHLVWVPPYVPHRIRAFDRQIGVVMVEPESTDMVAVEKCIQHSLAPAKRPAFTARVFEGFERLQMAGTQVGVEDDYFDALFLGQALPARPLDARVQRVVDQICSDTAGACSAQDLARSEGLSFSRFLHLFKSETGVSLRKYRAWRRARSLLYYVTSDATLTDIALETGYPDSTHFSHSIRRIYGLPPREIVAGSRRLQVQVQWPGQDQLEGRGLLASSHKSRVRSAVMV